MTMQQSMRTTIRMTEDNATILIGAEVLGNRMI
jgi:hypothetical protein